MGPGLIERVWKREHERKTICMANWDKYTCAQLVTVAQCVGGKGLAVIMRLLAQDHKHWHSGMPDLTLWRTEPTPSALLVEVKGPRDTLSNKQLAWLSEMHFGGLDVQVCKIEEP